MTRTLQLEAASDLALKARGAAGAVATTATAEDVVVSISGVAIFFKKNDRGRRYYSDIDRTKYWFKTIVMVYRTVICTPNGWDFNVEMSHSDSNKKKKLL